MDDIFKGRFGISPRLDQPNATPRSELERETKNSQEEEAIFQFFKSELHAFFTVLNDLLLFVKLILADGLDTR